MPEPASKRPNFTGPWRRDEQAHCWWRPYAVPIGSIVVHDAIALFDDGTRWNLDF